VRGWIQQLVILLTRYGPVSALVCGQHVITLVATSNMGRGPARCSCSLVSAACIWYVGCYVKLWDLGCVRVLPLQPAGGGQSMGTEGAVCV